MSTTVTQLDGRIRRAMADYPALDAITAQVGNTGATVVVPATNGGNFVAGMQFVIDQEAFMVQSVSTNSVTALRAWNGTSLATHTINTPILIKPRFGPQTILEAINEAYRNLWPYWFKWVEDESTITTGNLIADYALPAAFGATGIVTTMDILLPGLANDGWRTFRWFKHREGTTASLGGVTGRMISLIRIPPVGTYLRFVGFAPYTGDLGATDTLDSTLLDSAIPALVIYAQHYLASVGEAQRDNSRTARNIGGAATTPGQNQTVSQFHFQRFMQYCQTHQQRLPEWRTRRKM